MDGKVNKTVDNPTLTNCRICDSEFESEFSEFMGIEIKVGLCPRCDKAQQDKLAEQEKARLKEIYYDRFMNVCPPIYRQTDPTRLNQDRLKQILGWKYGPQGLMLAGVPGGGKTRSMWLLIRRLIFQGYQVKAFDSSFSDRIGAMFFENTSDAVRALDRIKQADVLFLDEYGKYNWTESFVARIFQVIDYRMSAGLPTLSTTNIDPETMKVRMKQMDEYKDAMERRLIEFSEVITFEEKL